MRPTLSWGLAVGSYALALVFALPSCITAAVWSDDRTSTELADCDLEHSVFRLAGQEGRILLKIPNRWAPHFTATPGQGNATWLEVTPVEHGHTVASLGGSAWFRFRHIEYADGSRPEWRLNVSVSPHEAQYRTARRLPGFSKKVSYYFRTEFDVLCTVKPCANPPSDRGPALVCTSLSHERRNDDGSSVVTRILWTPLALCGDVVLLPFQLLIWIQ